MRIKKDDYEIALKKALSNKIEVPAEFEIALFSKAENLLTKRRELIASREVSARQKFQARKHQLTWAFGQVVDFFAIHPSTPAIAATLATLVLAFVALHGTHERLVRFSYADLPAFPKNNDAPARYDAQVLAERQAYEREVENAHQQTSGGF